MSLIADLLGQGISIADASRWRVWAAGREIDDLNDTIGIASDDLPRMLLCLVGHFVTSSSPTINEQFGTGTATGLRLPPSTGILG